MQGYIGDKERFWGEGIVIKGHRKYPVVLELLYILKTVADTQTTRDKVA